MRRGLGYPSHWPFSEPWNLGVVPRDWATSVASIAPSVGIQGRVIHKSTQNKAFRYRA